MIKVFVIDGEIVKKCSSDFFESEKVEGAEVFDYEGSHSDEIVYEGGGIVLLKNSTRFASMVDRLLSKEVRTEQEQRELDYLLSL